MERITRFGHIFILCIPKRERAILGEPVKAPHLMCNDSSRFTADFGSACECVHSSLSPSIPPSLLSFSQRLLTDLTKPLHSHPPDPVTCMPPICWELPSEPQHGGSRQPCVIDVRLFAFAEEVTEFILIENKKRRYSSLHQNLYIITYLAKALVCEHSSYELGVWNP